MTNAVQEIAPAPWQSFYIPQYLPLPSFPRNGTLSRRRDNIAQLTGALLSGSTMRGRSPAHSFQQGGRLPRVGIACDLHGCSRGIEPGGRFGAVGQGAESRVRDTSRGPSLFTTIKPTQQIATVVQCVSLSFAFTLPRLGHSVVRRRGLHDFEQSPEDGKSAGASAWAGKARGAGASALGLEAGSRCMQDARIICTLGPGVGTNKA